MPTVKTSESLIDRCRKFAGTTKGQVVGVILAVIGLALIAMMIHSMFGPSDAAAATRNRVFICAESGKSYRIKIDKSTPIPAPSPYSGKNSGYPAELCYWTRDGQIKDEPTPVLLNHWLGKSEPTFCPDCGRLVVAHNPYPVPGSKPPPTQEEYNATHSSDGP